MIGVVFLMVVREKHNCNGCAFFYLKNFYIFEVRNKSNHVESVI